MRNQFLEIDNPESTGGVIVPDTPSGKELAAYLGNLRWEQK
jgi:hypothetical protein